MSEILAAVRADAAAPSAKGSLRVALLRHKAVRYPVYQEIFEAVSDTLRQEGAQVDFVDALDDVRAAKHDLLLVVGAPTFVDDVMGGLSALRRREGRSPLIFLWHLEHLPDPAIAAPILWAMLAKNRLEAWRRGGRLGNSRAANFHVIRAADAQGLLDQIYVFTPRKVDFLHRHRIASEYLPCGHHSLWGSPGEDERDVDVLFLGEVLEDRRGRIVGAVRNELAREGIALKTMYDFNPIGLWGEERNALLRRTKIYLSVYRHPADFSGLRFSLGMGNGAVIVSEPVADPYPFVPGTHYVQAPIEALAPTIVGLLRDDAQRRRIREQATALLTNGYTMRQSAAKILARAAELAGR